MKNPAAGFGVNTYSYIFDGSGADTVARLADQGYGGVELMFFPGHLWPAELDASQLRGLRQLCEARLRLVAVNMPNVDMNIAAAAEEMRAYTLDLLLKFVRCAGELGAGGIIIGPGKANPLFPMPRDRMISHFYRALDVAGWDKTFHREHAVCLPPRRGIADERGRRLWRRQHPRDLRRGQRALHRRIPRGGITPGPRPALAGAFLRYDPAEL